ncbi:hypothetical protein D1816_03305 [Aquimarina sp. AD10]|uniref:DUF6146 family protein n=1 Tax=Aquimarina sp. AD10 TaxID=1714849 RepID=UPI000E4FE142|nr:DUF6146 family protein [Aquimarina sp. AD10]AXT59415.1 hypothetical protein D1816_03305 [Aquimarina sp. AD10]RKN00317.1 hypothetical protein D7033_08135 [Aquimarina sp. AD10]
MKYLIYACIIALFIAGCATTKTKDMDTASIDTTSDTLRIANDSLEYEILIIEPGFTQWLVTQPPRGFYGERFLEIRNRQYVIEFNQRVLQPQRFNPNVYMQQINYEQNISYGYEVNYLLFNYFRFFEQRYRQRFIATRGGRF